MIVSNVEEDRFFRGEDKVLRFKVYERDGVTPKDVTGRTLSYVLLKTVKSTDPVSANFPKTTADDVTISGTFNANPNLNTQVVEVEFFDTDTDDLTPRTYYHELKDMTDAEELVLMRGEFVLTASAAPHRV